MPKFISHSVYLSVDLINTLYSVFLSVAQLFRFLHMWTLSDGWNWSKEFFRSRKFLQSAFILHFIEHIQSTNRCIWVHMAQESVNGLNAPDEEILVCRKCKLIWRFKVPSLSPSKPSVSLPDRRLIQYNKLLECFVLISYQNHTLIR